jgi:alpha-galactosidase
MTSMRFRSNASAAVLCALLVACASQTTISTDYPPYQETPTNPAMQPVADDPRLPRVLLIGDSISIGYTVPVRGLLKGIANVHRIPENGGPTTRGLAKLDEWLGTNEWGVIHFNWGLHDLKLEAPGQHQVELEEYELNLARLLDRLQRTGAALIWATTTPVPKGVKGPERDPADVPRYNEAARRVMEAAGVRINDLYAFTQPRLEGVQIPQNVHFTAAGSGEIARPVARQIREALKERRRTGIGIRTNASPNRDELATCQDWVRSHLGGQSRRPPFSFELEGRASPEFLPDWPVRSNGRKLDKARTERTLAWTDPRSGLVVRCVAVEYAHSPAVEWTVYFKNTGATPTPILKNIQGLDAFFRRADKGEFHLHGIKGDSCTADSYEPYQLELLPGLAKSFSPPEYSGKSCDGPNGWPYYNLQMPEGGGVILAVGWPGQWASSFMRDAGRGLRITAGQQRTHLVLEPGEEIRTPLIALLFWKGYDVVRAQNLWRRWFIDNNLARTRGQPQSPTAQIQVDGSPENIAYVKSFLDAGIKPDICWRDAGGAHTWYPNQTGPYTGNDSWLNTGTWEIDPMRYPQGFKPFSDWVRGNGMQFLLWFEPERVGDTNSWLAKNHPEWLLPGSSHGSILNLGNPAAFNWLVNHLDKMVKTQGLDWYREDMNGAGPLPAWRKNDSPDRQGITENFYVQGHLALWDELRRRNPGLRIDSCASGGRRNDLESMRRAAPLLRSDFQFPDMKGVVEANQGHTYGLSFWLPFQGIGCYLYEPYAFRSFYLPSFGMGGLTRANEAAQKQAYRECSRIASLMLGDYYPLTGYSLKEDAWIAWQFDRPELGMGAVQAFRRAGSPEASRRFKLHGLRLESRYETEDLDGGRRVVSGKELMQEGLSVTLSGKPAASVVIYRRLTVGGKGHLRSRVGPDSSNNASASSGQVPGGRS